MWAQLTLELDFDMIGKTTKEGNYAKLDNLSVSPTI